MFVTPVATPVTTPVADPTVAIVVLPLIHEPPDGVPDNVIAAPTHKEVGPDMVAEE